MSNQGDGQGPGPDERPEQGPPGNPGAQPLPGRPGGHQLPGQGAPQQQPGPPQQQPAPQAQQPGGSAPAGNAGEQWNNPGGQQTWSGGEQPWTGGQPQPWTTGGQEPQPPSWSTGETGPNVGPTMGNPQSSYYDQFSAASGEGVVVPSKGGGGGGGRGKVLIGAAAALVVVIAAVAIFALTRGDNSPKKAAATPSTSSLPPVTATTWVNPTVAAGQRALKPGWQAQQADDNRGIFDVPKNSEWTLSASDTLFGYDDNKGNPLVVTKAPAQFAVGFCPSAKTDQTAWLGLVNVGKRDPSDAGPDVAQRTADAIALKNNGSKAKESPMSPAKQIKVDQGTIPALEYTITTAVGTPNACEKGKQYEVRTVTFSAGGKSYQLVSVRLLGAPAGKELSASLLDEIFTTFRPSN
ncbi:hypothetical protein [Flexivirga caeni]|uniref:hypothetical protein n=1 Tax=Flexivirga caeni TaxID=2294115 RepID=UPI0011CE33F9|nr:hypothetical protein [Flexivirga caeni]